MISDDFFDIFLYRHFVYTDIIFSDPCHLFIHRFVHYYFNIFTNSNFFMNVLSQGTNAYDTYSLEKFSETFIVQN